MRSWTPLRVAVLGAIWRVRCDRQGHHGGASFARRAVLMALRHLVRVIQHDWTRTQSDVRQMDDGAYCVDWWRGFDCSLSVIKFEQAFAVVSLRAEGLDAPVLAAAGVAAGVGRFVRPCPLFGGPGVCAGGLGADFSFLVVLWEGLRPCLVVLCG